MDKTTWLGPIRWTTGQVMMPRRRSRMAVGVWSIGSILLLAAMLGVSMFAEWLGEKK